MSDVEFIDSKMSFRFSSDDAFHIEKSKLVDSLGIKICEVVVRKDNKLVFIEAKSSFSNPANPVPYKKNIDEIVEKFRCSWLVVIGLFAKRPYPITDSLPGNLQCKNAAHLPFSGVLILRDHPNDKLLEVDEAINQCFSKNERKLLCINSIKVINGEMAKRFGIIQDLVNP